MKTNNASVGRRSFFPTRTFYVYRLEPVAPVDLVISARVSIVTLSLVESCSMRYCDMLAASDGPRTSIVTDSA